jgi:hypothetical protein
MKVAELRSRQGRLDEAFIQARALGERRDILDV